jgi:hypothetical protein
MNNKTQLLQRKAFKTDRTLEFFSESELTTQIGYRKGLWPLVTVKELIDNAIDACETAGTPAIEIGVQLDNDSVTITDNGPGIPDKVVKGVLDYTSRISDKKHYVSPTRGQLGNALKCVIAVAFVSTGNPAWLKITAKGRCYRIDVELDRIKQRPRIACKKSDCPGATGTSVKVHWPEIGSYLIQDWMLHMYGDFASHFDNLAEAVTALINQYRVFNPHLSFTLNGKHLPATDRSWQKWRTDAPTSAHWYWPNDLRNLIAAHLAEQDGELPVRDFIGQFAGLARTDVRSDVLRKLKMERARLSDLIRGGDVDIKAVTRLLDGMREHSKPIQPARLGVLGKDHLAGCLAGLGGKNFQYDRQLFIDNEGLPVVLETAFAHKSRWDEKGQCLFGLNWSPVFKVPSTALNEALAHYQVETDDPVILAVHLVRPRFDFTDHGKAAI